MYKHLHPLIVGRKEAIKDEANELVEKRKRFPSSDRGIMSQVFQGTNRLRDRLGFKNVTSYELASRDGEKEYKYNLITSKEFPGVTLIAYQTKGTAMGHMVVAIDRENHVEYYNSRGKPIEDIPLRGVAFNKEVRSNPHVHQHKAPVCARHSLTRACFNHMTNDEYNATIRAAMDKYGLSADGVVHGITNKTIESGFLLKPEKPTSMKKGGIIKVPNK